MRWQERYEYDQLFVKECEKDAKSLNNTPLYEKMLPSDIEDVASRLLSSRKPQTDIGGLIGLILIGGVEEDEIASWLNHAFSVDTKNLLFECEQNISVLIFGITFDDVSTLA